MRTSMEAGWRRKILRIYLRRVHIFQPAFQLLLKDLEINWFRNASIATRLEKTALLGYQSVCGNGDYRDVFTSRETFMTRALGMVYGVPIEQSTGWVRYVFPEGSPRAGLLTQMSYVELCKLRPARWMGRSARSPGPERRVSQATADRPRRPTSPIHLGSSALRAARC